MGLELRTLDIHDGKTIIIDVPDASQDMRQNAQEYLHMHTLPHQMRRVQSSFGHQSAGTSCICTFMKCAVLVLEAHRDPISRMSGLCQATKAIQILVATKQICKTTALSAGACAFITLVRLGSLHALHDTAVDKSSKKLHMDHLYAVSPCA